MPALTPKNHLPRESHPMVRKHLFNEAMARIEAGLGGNSFLVERGNPAAFPTVEEALVASREGDFDLVTFLLGGSEPFNLPSGFLLDLERDYAFVSVAPFLDRGSGRSQLVGDIDTTVAVAIDLFHNRTVTFDGVQFAGTITIRKGREWRVFGGMLENTSLNFVFSDSMFDAPRASFYSIQQNGGFWFDTLDVPAGFVLAYVDFYDSELVLNDSVGPPFKLFGNLGPTVSLIRSDILWGNSVGGVSLFDFEGTDPRVIFKKSIIDLTGSETPGPLFADAASGRVVWQGNCNELWRDPAIGVIAVGLSGPTHTGYPSVDTGTAPTGRPVGTIYKDRGVTETLLFWNGVAWV